MSTLDWIILGLFFLGLIGIIVWVLLQKEKDTSDYFLAGRDATWIAIGASIFASNIGSEHLVGLAGAGAESGLAMAHWEMHGWMILMLGWLFVPFYARSKVFTMPEFLERRYNPQARSFLSIISIVSYVLTKVAVTVYAGGVVFKDVFNIDYVTFFGYNIDFFWISAIGLVVLTGLYTTFGGMKAVLYTSVLQTPILLIGSIAILVLGLIKVGGWNELMEITRANVTVHGDEMTSLMRSHNDPDFPWTGVILGSAIIGFWYWCTDQFIVQRVLSGRDMKQARRGAIFGAYLKLTPVFIFLIPGMIAYALNQKGLITLSSNDAAFSTLVTELLPIGFKGIVIGGILAALMSSLASLFNSSAMLFTIDFYKKYKPEASEKHYVLVGRIATVVIVMLGILWIPVMKGIGKVLYEYLQDVQSLLAPGIAAVFLLGILSKKTTPAAGLWGLIIGFTLGMLRLGLNIFSGSIEETSFIYKMILSHNWLHYEIYLFFLVIISMVIISYFTKPKDPHSIVGLTMGSATAAQRAETRSSYNHWDVINSVVIICIILIFYAYFW
ncbi:Na+/glucose cotransporter [Maribellus luteus]|uniref:Na+/glucose cotransporter n=1 Tax=Maribellus luteus TaxID=2305463 RepID=A0A399SX58_9BACT|nr:sodium:solute symporter [Maribellus luteus]RIJ46627.1 Na+/glucose cotransporter [Maribellus luteus]